MKQFLWGFEQSYCITCISVLCYSQIQRVHHFIYSHLPYSSFQIGKKDIFGLGSDQINLASRFDTCSYGQLKFEPFNGLTTGGPTVTDGVYELDISDYRINGKLDSAAENYVISAATQELGNLEDQFDYVMICLPVRDPSDFSA